MSETISPKTQPQTPLKPDYIFLRTIFGGDVDEGDCEVVERRGYLEDALWDASGDMLFRDLRIVRLEATDAQTGERVVMESHEAVRQASMKLWPDVFAAFGPRAAYKNHLAAIAGAKEVIETRARDVTKLMSASGQHGAADVLADTLRQVMDQLAGFQTLAGEAADSIPEIE